MTLTLQIFCVFVCTKNDKHFLPPNWLDFHSQLVFALSKYSMYVRLWIFVWMRQKKNYIAEWLSIFEFCSTLYKWFSCRITCIVISVFYQFEHSVGSTGRHFAVYFTCTPIFLILPSLWQISNLKRFFSYLFRVCLFTRNRYRFKLNYGLSLPLLNVVFETLFKPF